MFYHRVPCCYRLWHKYKNTCKYTTENNNINVHVPATKIKKWNTSISHKPSLQPFLPTSPFSPKESVPLWTYQSFLCFSSVLTSCTLHSSVLDCGVFLFHFITMEPYGRSAFLWLACIPVNISIHFQNYPQIHFLFCIWFWHWYFCWYLQLPLCG